MSLFDKRMDRYRQAQYSKENAEVQVTVRNLHQLKEAIIPFLPKSGEDKSTITTSTNDVKYDSREKTVANGTITAEVSVPNMNKLLCQGLEIAENQAAIAELSLEKEDFGGFMPAVLPRSETGYLWVDTLIKYRLDGHRRNNLVAWNLGGDTFLFDPRTGQLTQEQ